MSEPAHHHAPVIEVEDATLVSMRAPSVVHARGIDWSIAPGEFWVVAGLQGAGKTDLLMMLAGLLPPASGACRWFGSEEPLGNEGRLADRLRVGLVFEGAQLLHQLTVRENVALPLRYHRNQSLKSVAPAVDELLHVLGLTTLAEHSPGALGRNWQRRAALARALALNPEVLLVDSPLAGLDLRHAHWWLEFLQQLSSGHPLMNHKPMTLVTSAADLRSWRGVAQKCALLTDDRLVVVGNWSELDEAKRPVLSDFYD
jgi:ABC-type transporter Mla maintaining outer membrane lipid asymmetry ATPase subunit MlaF